MHLKRGAVQTWSIETETKLYHPEAIIPLLKHVYLSVDVCVIKSALIAPALLLIPKDSEMSF